MNFDDKPSGAINTTDEVSLASPTPDSWLDAPSLESDDGDESVDEYDIVSSPNDWNFMTIVSFIESGALRIPSFQRNYVWDKKRASKLIESLLLGLPVPQVFLYEKARNEFLVIDGQQRLLSLYFFAKGRFPRPKVRGEIRPSLSQGLINEQLLHDDEFFEDFQLVLPKTPSEKPNRFGGLSYLGLKQDKTSLDLRTMRNIVVKQTSPEGDSAVYEIFSRLNTGGVNLTPQEIRASLYHSDLIDGLLELNLNPSWRRLVGTTNLDPRMRDTEFLLRSLALGRGLDSFSGSMVRFINKFCSEAREFSPEQTQQALASIRSFTEKLDEDKSAAFRRAGKFSGVLFEAFFAAWIRSGSPNITSEQLAEAVNTVKVSPEFTRTLQEGSTKPINIRKRISVAEDAIASATGGVNVENQ